MNQQSHLSPNHQEERSLLWSDARRGGPIGGSARGVVELLCFLFFWGEFGSFGANDGDDSSL